MEGARIIGIDLGSKDAVAVTVFQTKDGRIFKHSEVAKKHDDWLEAAALAGLATASDWHKPYNNPEGYDEPQEIGPQSRRLTHRHPKSHATHVSEQLLHEDCVDCYPNSLCSKCKKPQPCTNRGCIMSRTLGI